MKKIIVLLLAMVCVLGVMTACSSTSDVDVNVVKEKLVNTTWVSEGQDYATGEEFTSVWTFGEDVVIAKNTLGAEEFKEDKAAYTVKKDGTINLTWDEADNNRITEFYFTFENDELKIYADKEKEAEFKRQ